MDENIKTTVDEGAKTASNSATDATPKQTKTADRSRPKLPRNCMQNCLQTTSV